jgi:hypothetical protein
LLGEYVDGYCRFILRPEKIEQDKKLSMMDANFRHPTRHTQTPLLLRQRNDGFSRARDQPALHKMVSMPDVGVQLSLIHVQIVSVP